MTKKENSMGMDIVWSYIKAFLDWFASKPSILFGIAVVCIVLVMMPESYREYLGYDGIIEPYRGWISIIGLTSGILWLVFILTKLTILIYYRLVKKWKDWRFNKLGPTILRDLSAQEKSYLAKYIKTNRSSLDFEISDGVINALQKKGVVYQASYVSKRFYNWDFNLQPWVLRTLKEHTQLKNEILKHYKPPAAIL